MFWREPQLKVRLQLGKKVTPAERVAGRWPEQMRRTAGRRRRSSGGGGGGDIEDGEERGGGGVWSEMAFGNRVRGFVGGLEVGGGLG